MREWMASDVLRRPDGRRIWWCRRRLNKGKRGRWRIKKRRLKRNKNLSRKMTQGGREKEKMKMVRKQNTSFVVSYLNCAENHYFAGTASYLITWVFCGIWGSHSGGYEECQLVWYNAMQSVESQQTFRRHVSPPSLLATCSHSGFLLGLYLNHEDGEIYSSETSIDIQRTTRRDIPEYGTFR
jgi:hypothetical protein